MDTGKIKSQLPTIPKYLERRRKQRQNQLPKHLRAPAIWPLWVQLVLNSALIVTLYNLMVDRDDYLTEAGPAMVLVVCLLILIYTLISAVRLRRIYDKIKGHKLAKVNLGLMMLAFIFWAASIVVFLP